MTFRTVGGEHLTTTVPSSKENADAEAIVKAGAELAMKLVDPYTLAASVYNDERSANSTDFERTIGVLEIVTLPPRFYPG